MLPKWLDRLLTPPKHGNEALNAVEAPVLIVAKDAVAAATTAIHDPLDEFTSGLENLADTYATKVLGAPLGAELTPAMNMALTFALHAGYATLASKFGVIAPPMRTIAQGVVSGDEPAAV